MSVKIRTKISADRQTAITSLYKLGSAMVAEGIDPEYQESVKYLHNALHYTINVLGTKPQGYERRAFINECMRLINSIKDLFSPNVSYLAGNAIQQLSAMNDEI